jgi:2-polyprenyl-3-methyl-5-hydroxy-6-metoxy-1,4-benzoquinol methylase
VATCCNPRGCDQTFTDRFARRMANRYRKRGLDKTAKRMVELITAKGLDGATVLEVGGGVGEIQLELLQRGAARATNLELSESYEQQAQQLLAEAGMTDRVQRRIVDIAAAPDDVELADVVVLHRVVCCYPDYAKLLDAVASHTRRLVVFSYPPRNLASRAAFGAENLSFRLRRSQFRVFTHPPQAMLDVLHAHGLHTSTMHQSMAWHIVTGQR